MQKYSVHGSSTSSGDLNQNIVANQSLDCAAPVAASRRKEQPFGGIDTPKKRPFGQVSHLVLLH